jgi:hypothetical protein
LGGISKKLVFKKYQWFFMGLWVIYLLIILVALVFALVKGEVDNNAPTLLLVNGITGVFSIFFTLYFLVNGIRVIRYLSGAVLGALQKQLFRVSLA